MQNPCHYTTLKIRMGVTTVLTLLLAGCSDLPQIRADLSQCHIDSFGIAGTRFMREFGFVEPEPRKQQDYAYNNFIVTCMSAKGYEFAEMITEIREPLEKSAVDESCWILPRDGRRNTMPNAYNAGCYRTSIW